jgi:hypothetical protein
MEFLSRVFITSITIIVLIIVIIYAHKNRRKYIPALHVVIVTNMPNDSRLGVLKTTLSKTNFSNRDIFVLNTGIKFSWNERLWAWKKFFKSLPPESIVLSLDAFDVIVLGSKEEILSKFLSMNKKLVFGWTDYCWPTYCEICIKRENTVKRLNPYTKKYCYLCAGVYIGRAGFLYDLLEKNPWPEDVDDQCYFATIFENQGNTDIILDFKNFIFQSTTSNDYNNGLLRASEKDKHRLYHSQFKTEPSIFHFDSLHYSSDQLKKYYTLMTQKPL